jgi:hypothetical protein
MRLAAAPLALHARKSVMRTTLFVLLAVAACGAQAADPSSRQLGAGDLNGSGANGKQSGAATTGVSVGGAGGGVGNSGRNVAGPRIRVDAAARAASRAPAAAPEGAPASAPARKPPPR